MRITIRGKQDDYTMTSDIANVSKIRDDEFWKFTLPFIGYRGHVSLDVRIWQDSRDVALANKIMEHLHLNDGLALYKQPYLPHVANYWPNLKRLYTERLDVTRSIVSFIRSMSGQPVIICGGGPSLLNDIDYIRQVIEEETAIVIAAGSAIRIFHKEDIKPHFCYAIDPYGAQWETVFEHIDPEWTRGLTLIHELCLNQKCYEMWQGDFIVNGGNTGILLTDRLDGLPFVGNGWVGVSTGMCNLMRVAKPSELHLAGFDLCFQVWQGERICYADGHDHDSYEMIEHEGIPTRALWVREAQILGKIAHECSFKVYRWIGGFTNLMPIPNTIDVDEYQQFEEECEPLEYRDYTPLANNDWVQLLEHNCNTLYPQVEQMYSKLKDEVVDQQDEVYDLLVRPWDQVLKGQELCGAEYDWPVMWDMMRRTLYDMDTYIKKPLLEKRKLL